MLHSPIRDEEPRLVNGRPEGQLDYEARCAIRDLVRLHGFETARDLVAGFLNDEADRRRQ